MKTKRSIYNIFFNIFSLVVNITLNTLVNFTFLDNNSAIIIDKIIDIGNSKNNIKLFLRRFI